MSLAWPHVPISVRLGFPCGRLVRAPLLGFEVDRFFVLVQVSNRVVCVAGVSTSQAKQNLAIGFWSEATADQTRLKLVWAEI